MQHQLNFKVTISALGCNQPTVVRTVTNHFGALFSVQCLRLTSDLFCCWKRNHRMGRERQTDGFLLNKCVAETSHMYTHACCSMQPRGLRRSIAFPFFLAHTRLFHPVFIHFFQSHDPSRTLSHIGSSPGRRFSCSLLGCNNYSISQQRVP